MARWLPKAWASENWLVAALLVLPLMRKPSDGRGESSGGRGASAAGAGAPGLGAGALAASAGAVGRVVVGDGVGLEVGRWVVVWARIWSAGRSLSSNLAGVAVGETVISWVTGAKSDSLTSSFQAPSGRSGKE